MLKSCGKASNERVDIFCEVLVDYEFIVVLDALKLCETDGVKGLSLADILERMRPDYDKHPDTWNRCFDDAIHRFSGEKMKHWH